MSQTRKTPVLSDAQIVRFDNSARIEAARRRVQLALKSLASPSAVVEVRDAEPTQPDEGWQKRALAFVAMVSISAAVGLTAYKLASSTNTAATADQRTSAGKVVNLAPPNQIVLINGQKYEVLHPIERIRLCKEVAQRQGLSSKGLDWKDVYAVVHAESGWAARDGIGRNGKVSRGIAQIEDATANALGVDANDPEQSLHAVGVLIKDAAAWSQRKGHRIHNGAISVFYNLSTSARNRWNGSSDELPYETKRHIQQSKQGRKLASQLESTWVAAHASQDKSTQLIQSRVKILEKHAQQAYSTQNGRNNKHGDAKFAASKRSEKVSYLTPTYDGHREEVISLVKRIKSIAREQETANSSAPEYGEQSNHRDRSLRSYG